MTKLIFSLLFVLGLAGCAAPAPQLSTPSGNPEVNIVSTTKKQVLDLIVSAVVSDGGQIKNVNDYGVTIAKRTKDFASSFIYGSRYDSIPEARVTFTVIEGGNAVRVMARAEMVTNPGSAHERASDVTSAEAQSLQNMLEKLRSQLQRY